jgi:hypothetical protein
LEKGKQVVLTNEPNLRIFNGRSYSEGLGMDVQGRGFVMEDLQSMKPEVAIGYDDLLGIILWGATGDNSNTDLCLRFTIKAEQGRLWSELYGDDWIYPQARVGTFFVFSTENQRISLVYDSRKGRPYMLSTKDGPPGSGLTKQYLDRKTNYGGTEIPWELYLKEHYGEKKEMLIRYLQGHVTIRAENEIAKQGTTGYTAKGYRNALKVSLFTLVDGNKVEVARTYNIPEYGDIPFDKIVEGRRVQLGIAGTAGEVLITGVAADYEMKDLRAAPSLRLMDHHNRQAAIAAPFLWFSRNSEPLLNLGDGTTIADGSIVGTTTGPDGRDASAMVFGPNSEFEIACQSITGDYSIMFFAAVITGNVDIIEFVGLTVSIQKVGAIYTLVITDSGATYSHDLSWDGTGWVAIKIVRSGINLEFAENGVNVDKFVLPAVNSYDGPAEHKVMNEMHLFDIRVLASVVTDDDEDYYYHNVTEKEGYSVLPNF